MSIADKLNYLITTKGLLKDNINKINNVLDDNSTFRSYPEELFNGYLDILNNGTDTLWNNLEKVSQTGTEAVLEGVETAPMKMVLNGNTSQDGTPTPDTPVEVKVVTGENVVSVSGKNMFDKSITLHSGWYNDNGVFQSSTGTSHTEEKYKVRPNETYTLSGNAIAYDTTYVFARIYYYDKDKNWLSRSVITQPTYSFVIPSNCHYIDFQISIGSSYVDDWNRATDNLQLEQGSTATPYVPYSKTDYPISLGTIEMCKIRDYQDFFFKAINGDEYYDTLTAEQKNALVYGKWYVHKAIGKVVFDGSENGWASYTQGATYYRTNIYISDAFKSSGSGRNNICVCSHFKYNNTYSSDSIGNYFFNNADKKIYVYPLQQDSLSNFKTWLSSNNVTVYYILATPTEEEITDTTLIEQLEAIYKAKSVKDKTYITQTNDELPFILDVEAIKEYSVE